MEGTYDLYSNRSDNDQYIIHFGILNLWEATLGFHHNFALIVARFALSSVACSLKKRLRILPTCNFNIIELKEQWILLNPPEGFFGIASMNSTPPASHLYWTLLSFTNWNAEILGYGSANAMGEFFTLNIASLILSFSFLVLSASIRASASVFSTMKAIGTSPLKSSGTPITPASPTSGWSKRWPSSSAGATWKPRTLNISYETETVNKISAM